MQAGGIKEQAFRQIAQHKTRAAVALLGHDFEWLAPHNRSELNSAAVVKQLAHIRIPKRSYMQHRTCCVRTARAFVLRQPFGHAVAQGQQAAITVYGNGLAVYQLTAVFVRRSMTAGNQDARVKKLTCSGIVDFSVPQRPMPVTCVPACRNPRAAQGGAARRPSLLRAGRKCACRGNNPGARAQRSATRLGIPGQTRHACRSQTRSERDAGHGT